ncbi:pili assembly chaperone [Pseudomonas chlororaphis subsp. aureofaciens]|nr:pili assembly chaperone [Pseudomonas chlororaphis subsp. aureofaciens]
MGSKSFTSPIDMVAPATTFQVEVSGLPNGVQVSDLKVEFEAIVDLYSCT